MQPVDRTGRLSFKQPNAANFKVTAEVSANNTCRGRRFNQQTILPIAIVFFS